MSIRRLAPPFLLASIALACALPGPRFAFADSLDDPAQRRLWVLELFANRPWQPLRDYSLDTVGCLRLNADIGGIAASLELHKLGRPQSVTPAKADPWLVHVAKQIRRLNGASDGPPGPCRRTGGPSTANAATRIGQIMLRHHPTDGWSPALLTAARAMVSDTHWAPTKAHLTNLTLGLPMMRLLVGEALCDAGLWSSGVEAFNAMFRGVLERGGFEMNAIHYSHHHFEVLFAALDLADPVVREQGRLLLEYELLTAAHLYLPGAGLLPPYSRAREGALRIAEHRARSLGPVLVYLSRDPDVDLRGFAGAHGGLLGPALSDYAMPEIIRSIFLERGTYTWGARHWRNASPGRAPHLVYPQLGWNGRGATFPWQARVIAGARAGIGLSHGSHVPEIDPVSSGVHVRCPSCDAGWIVLFQGQRLERGDRDATGTAVLERAAKPGPRDGYDEGTDFAGQLFGDTMLRVWAPPRERRRPFTETYLPNWDHPMLGGRRGGWPTPGGWYVGELSGVRVGYHPLGGGEPGPSGQAAEPRDPRCPAARSLDFSPRRGGPAVPGLYHVLCLPGASGGVTVVESGGHRDLVAFAADLDARRVDFQPRGAGGQPVAEVDVATDDGRRCRIRLAYRPGPGPLETRSIDCAPPLGDFSPRDVVPYTASPESGGLDFGLMHSPWVRWTDAPEGVLRIAREGYPERVQRWSDALLRPGEPRPAVCAGASR